MSIAEKVGRRPAPIELPTGVAPVAKKSAPSLEITSLNVDSMHTNSGVKAESGNMSVCDGNSCNQQICSSAVCPTPVTEAASRVGGNVLTLQRRDGTGAPLRLGEFRVGAANPSAENGSVSLNLSVNSLRTSNERATNAQVSAGTEDECTFKGDACTGPSCNFAERGSVVKKNIITFGSRLNVADQKALDARAADAGSFDRWSGELNVSSLNTNTEFSTERVREKVKVGAVDVLSFEPDQNIRKLDTGTHGYMKCC